MQMKNKVKSEKGIMTMYVTIAVVTFTIILVALFSLAVATRKNQIKTLTFILFLFSLLRPCLYLSCRQYKPLCCSLCSGFYIKGSGRQKNDIYTFVS